MENIEQRVKKIVAEQLGVNEADIKNESSFVDDLGADSLDTVELVMALEEEFECEIPDEEAEKITTVQQAIDYVKHAKRQRRPLAAPRSQGGRLSAPPRRRHRPGHHLPGRQQRCRGLGEHPRRQIRHQPASPASTPRASHAADRGRGEGLRRRRRIMPPKEARRIDTFIHYGMAAASRRSAMPGSITRRETRSASGVHRLRHRRSAADRGNPQGPAKAGRARSRRSSCPAPSST